MFKLIEIELLTIQEENEAGAVVDVTYTHVVRDESGVFPDFPVSSDYDILKHNKDYFMNELWWLRYHSLPSSVEYKGINYPVDSSLALREKIESSLYKNGETFIFAVNGVTVELTRDDAIAIRDEIEYQTQKVYNQYHKVKLVIDSTSDFTDFNINHEWGLTCLAG